MEVYEPFHTRTFKPQSEIVIKGPRGIIWPNLTEIWLVIREICLPRVVVIFFGVYGNTRLTSTMITSKLRSIEHLDVENILLFQICDNLI